MTAPRLAVYEYRRHAVRELPPAVRGPVDLAATFRAIIEPDERETECLAVVALNTKNAPIGAEIVYTGNVSASLVRVGELFRLAVRMNASGIAIAHNHPSGDPKPSPDDLHLTAETIAAGKLLDIRVVDHIVLGADGAYASLRDRGVDFGR